VTAFLAAHPYLEGLWTGFWFGVASAFFPGALLWRWARRR
jgi:hypothetical protein